MTVANDNPFVKGDKVAVIREEHGWHDGRLTCIISSCYQAPNGIWSYIGIAVDENENWAGMEFNIRHTRDAYLLERRKKR